MEKKSYVPPTISELGSVHDLTLSNKIGKHPDIYTGVTNGIVVGSLVPTK